MGNAGQKHGCGLTTIDRNLALDARPWMSVWRETVRFPNGRTIPDYYMLEMPDVAVVVPLKSRDLVVALEQYRHGAGSKSITLPAGMIEADEDPLQAAKRELLEETGYTTTVWVSLGAFLRDANRGGGHVHIFLAQHVRPVSEPHPDVLEGGQVCFLSLDTLIENTFGSTADAQFMAYSLAALLAATYLQRAKSNKPLASGKCSEAARLLPTVTQTGEDA